MKGFASNIPKTLLIGCRMLCDDNSGARIVEVIGAIGKHGGRRRPVSVGIGDIAIVAVKKGSPQMKKKVERALVVRQKKEFRRANGMRVKFEDNAVVLVDENGLPKGTEIKGAIAREVAEDFPKVTAIAAAVV